ncbi:diguanylate cyclase domain-containing protein [Roseateles aquae]|uniref:diguanylate cyclase domain-containing protein n=1 Tax=Roseateles aquae TaxID=3077235 RepID=UPI0028E8B9A9|nr:diguanylate cyclase [Paucibacter sp. APW11]
MTRLNLLVLSLTLLICFVLIGTSSWYAARDRQVQAAELSAGLLGNSLAPMLAFEDRDAALNEVQAFSRRSDLLELQVLSASGQLFAHWSSDEKRPLQLAVSPAVVATLGTQSQIRGNEFDVWAPIKLKGEVVGTLRMRESLQSLLQTVWQMTLLATVLVVLAIALASWVLRMVQRAALRPLVDLAELAEQVTRDQDYSRRARIERLDEVGRLGERFNQMLSRAEVWQADLSQQLRKEQLVGQQMQQLANEDSLTKLPNRLFFQAELQRRVAHSVEHSELMALMFIDLDNFKTVNDSYGHDAGDEVLREVSRRMSRALRSSDVLCRLGGDEFALMLPALSDQAAAEQLAGRLIAAVREPLLVDGRVMPVGATVGLAFCPLDASDAAQLLARADTAMYAAKRAGKNTYRRACDASAA